MLRFRLDVFWFVGSPYVHFQSGTFDFFYELWVFQVINCRVYGVDSEILGIYGRVHPSVAEKDSRLYLIV